MPSAQLYMLERAGEMARDILDERIVEWTREGWTQQRVADELGCSQQAISKRQARLGVKSIDPRGSYNRVVKDDCEPETVEPDEILEPVGNGRILLPTNEHVVRRLAATAERNPQRAHEIWRAVVDRYGPDATAEQVGEIAAGVDGPRGLDKDAKRFLSAARKALKAEDPRAAKQAFAIWRASVQPELNRIARSGDR
jgi:hypothetical protein